MRLRLSWTQCAAYWEARITLTGRHRIPRAPSRDGPLLRADIYIEAGLSCDSAHAVALSHDVRIDTSRCSSVVRITGVAFGGWSHPQIIQVSSRPVAALNEVLGRTLRARVTDRIQDFGNRYRGGLRRNPGRWILMRDLECTLARVGVTAILHPAVVPALFDSSGVVEHRNGPAVQRPDRRPSFPRHQH